MTVHDSTKYPNLLRVARELSRCEEPDRVLNALLAMLRKEAIV